MSQTHKIHSESSEANISIPFKWEKQPGVSKLIIDSKDQVFVHNNPQFTANLPLPPSRLHPKLPSLRSSSLRGYTKQSSLEEDPFLVAFKECTKTKAKSTTPVPSRMDSGRFGLIMIKKRLSKFGCKKTSSVRDDALVKNKVLATHE